MIDFYKDHVGENGSHLFTNQRKCPFLGFKKCLGEECSLYSITGFVDNKGIRKDFGDCALVKLPGFLIDIKNVLTSSDSK